MQTNCVCRAATFHRNAEKTTCACFQMGHGARAYGPSDGTLLSVCELFCNVMKLEHGCGSQSRAPDGSQEAARIASIFLGVAFHDVAQTVLSAVSQVGNLRGVLLETGLRVTGVSGAGRVTEIYRTLTHF